SSWRKLAQLRNDSRTVPSSKVTVRPSLPSLPVSKSVPEPVEWITTFRDIRTPFSKNTDLERILQFVEQLLLAPRWFTLFVPFIHQWPRLLRCQPELHRKYARDAERPVMASLPADRALD